MHNSAQLRCFENGNDDFGVEAFWIGDAARAASFFFGARIWLGTILGRFSINYFSGLGLRIMVMVWVRVRVRVWVRVRVGVRVGVRVSVVIWSLYVLG